MWRHGRNATKQFMQNVTLITLIRQMKNKKSKIVKLGVVGVDSGQLIICDPAYLENQFQQPDSGEKSDHAHPVYRNKSDGKLWQFCYGTKPSIEGVNAINGTYSDIIPEYGLSANDLREKGLFEETDIDPTPHIPEAEFSYRGICKATNNNNQGGQLNYLLGHAGVAVAFRTGLGDGTYDVFAEIVDTGYLGERVKKVWVEFITDEELELIQKQKNYK